MNKLCLAKCDDAKKNTLLSYLQVIQYIALEALSLQSEFSWRLTVSVYGVFFNDEIILWILNNGYYIIPWNY